jgi:hypothetical protein
MRFRTTVAAAVGALALIVSLPGPASAAVGEFTYVYTDVHGSPATGTLTHPEGRECLTLVEAAGEYVPPAHSPRNRTNATAVAFTGRDCDGDYYSLEPGEAAGPRLKLRSVVFS